MADRIALLLDGRLLQVDRPRRFYEAPVSPEVARFFGWQLLAREGETLRRHSDRNGIRAFASSATGPP
jgi:ABC-type Fe3+/spermidine/putrescine transport system ATPase subunit